MLLLKLNAIKIKTRQLLLDKTLRQKTNSPKRKRPLPIESIAHIIKKRDNPQTKILNLTFIKETKVIKIEIINNISSKDG